MRELIFVAERQLLSKKDGCDFSNIAPGSSGLLAARFEFSEGDWDDCAKVAIFYNGETDHPALLVEDRCQIPAGALTGDRFQVAVIGGRAGGYRITTNKVTVRQEVW